MRDPPLVIFTTAYNQFALKAFEFGAFDYLVKPIHPARLARALARLHKIDDARDDPETAAAADTVLGEADQVFLKDNDRCWLVRVGDIRLLESEGNYARVYFGENRPLIPRSLQLLEKRLDPQRFLRVSRQHIINLRAVRKLEPSIDGGLFLWLGERDPQVKVGRRRAHELRERLSF